MSVVMNRLARNLVSGSRKVLSSQKTAHTRMFSSAQNGTWGVAFDVDGVLLRGKTAIPKAKETLELLQEHKVPYIFMTNGGGVLEKNKAASIEEILDIPVTADQMLLSHTPMKSLADKYADELVMLVGKDEIKNIAKSYGLNKTMTATELHEQVPDLFPDAQTTAAAHNPDFHEPVKAILVFLDPHHYHRDIQLCVDVLRSNGIVGTTHDGEQQVPIYFSCWDFEYVTEWPVPRFGAGIFAMTVDALYEQSTGHKLTKTVFGKPLRSTYEYAEQMLGVDHVYGVGDNPLSDIKGANEAGDNWSSVLVETGMFVPEQHADANGNHPEHPGDHVHPNVYDAIQAIVKQRTGQ